MLSFLFQRDIQDIPLDNDTLRSSQTAYYSKEKTVLASQEQADYFQSFSCDHTYNIFDHFFLHLSEYGDCPIRDHNSR